MKHTPITIALAAAIAVGSLAPAVVSAQPRREYRYDEAERYYRDACREERRDRRVAGGVIGAIAGGVIGNNVSGRRERGAGTVVGAVAVLIALWFAVAQFAFARGLWLDVTFPCAAILINAGAVAAVRAAIERGMRRNLSRYHSPMIVDMLAERASPRFEGSAQNAAILFVDMAGSTARLETMAPDAAVRFLRDFHGRIERAVLAHDGVVEKFMGDGAMVVFGIPKPHAGDAAAALACARALIDDIRAHNAELAAAGVPPIDVSIGIHYGPVIMARLGGATQAEVTAAGDTVNVASRLESLTRANDAAIVISDAAVAAIRAAGRLDLIEGFERLPPQEIRGRVERLAIWVRRRAA